MQISIYLDKKVVQKLDKRWPRVGRSRSSFIQSLIAREVGEEEKKPSPWRRACGLLQREPGKAHAMIGAIRKSRRNKKW